MQMRSNLVAILTLVAIGVSPVIAVLVSVWLQDRKERRAQKLMILGALIGTRHNPVSDETVRALNLIDVVFHDNAKIRQLWREYFDMLSNQGLENPAGWAQRQKKNLEMITEMAKALGYKKTITHLDVDRVYYPVGLGEQARKNAAVLDGFLDFFKTVATALPSRPPRDESP